MEVEAHCLAGVKRFQLCRPVSVRRFHCMSRAGARDPLAPPCRFFLAARHPSCVHIILVDESGGVLWMQKWGLWAHQRAQETPSLGEGPHDPLHPLPSPPESCG